MAAFPPPVCDMATLQRRLYDEYRVEVRVIDRNGRQSVRVSVQAYNTPGDIEALIAAFGAQLRGA
jgi:isopenicillin-N epimerase